MDRRDARRRTRPPRRRSSPARRRSTCPCQRTASVSGLKRAPSQTSQATLTSGRKLISIVLHALAFAGLAAAARGVERKAARACSRACALRSCRRTSCGSRPRSRRRWRGRSAASCRSASGRLRARARRCSQPLSSLQPTSAHVPCAGCWRADAAREVRVQHVARERGSCREPETPVTTVRRPSGTRTSTFFRLCSARAGDVDRRRVARRPRGAACSGCASGCARKRPVTDSGLRIRSAAVPSATTRPPRLPAPGPRSITCSARRMVSSSCSTTTSVLPFASSFASVSSRMRLSRGCRPIVGSSRM